MKENDFFIDATSVESFSNASLKESSDIVAENSSCFVINDEQGGQSKVRWSTDNSNFFMVDRITSSDPGKNIALIMTLCTSLFGIFMLLHGFIRDYISNGVTRIEMYLLLSQGFIGQTG